MPRAASRPPGRLAFGWTLTTSHPADELDADLVVDSPTGLEVEGDDPLVVATLT